MLICFIRPVEYILEIILPLLLQKPSVVNALE